MLVKCIMHIAASPVKGFEKNFSKMMDNW